MDLQSAFYLAALIFLILGIVFFIGCIAFLALLFFTFRSAKNQLGERIENVIDYSKKKSATTGLGLMLVGKILSKLKNNKNA